MKIKIKLLNKARLEVVKVFFIQAINFNIESINYIDYYNALQICKKFSDVIFKRTIAPSPGVVKFSIDINEFYTFTKICTMFADDCDQYAAILMQDIINEGNKQTAQIEHQHTIQRLKKNEIL